MKLGEVPELSQAGGAIYLEGRGLKKPVLIVRAQDDKYLAFASVCPHMKRKIDPVPGQPFLRCCSVMHSTFDYEGRKISMAGWLIAERRHGLKGRGCMKFLTLEDAAGVFEAILFPKTYQAYGHLLTSHGPYVITGRVQCEDFNTVLMVDRIALATERESAVSSANEAARQAR